MIRCRHHYRRVGTPDGGTQWIECMHCDKQAGWVRLILTELDLTGWQALGWTLVCVLVVAAFFTFMWFLDSLGAAW